MNTYNSDGYILIDLKEADVTQTTQHISGLYNRVSEEVAKINKLAIVINAGNLTPLAAVVQKTLNYYVVTTSIYIFKINSNDILIIEEAGEVTVDVSIVPTLTEGVKVADFAIGTTEGSIYAPEFQTEINDSVTSDHLTWSSEKIDDQLDLKADTSDVYTKSEVDTALSLKADTSDVYTKSEVDTALSSKANTSDVYTKSEVDTALSVKANTSDVYTKSEVDTALSVKANTSDVYTKSEVDTALSNKQTKLSIGEYSAQLNDTAWNGVYYTSIDLSASVVNYGTIINAIVIDESDNSTFIPHTNRACYCQIIANDVIRIYSPVDSNAANHYVKIRVTFAK